MCPLQQQQNWWKRWRKKKWLICHNIIHENWLQCVIHSVSRFVISTNNTTCYRFLVKFQAVAIHSWTLTKHRCCKRHEHSTKHRSMHANVRTFWQKFCTWSTRVKYWRHVRQPIVSLPWPNCFNRKMWYCGAWSTWASKNWVRWLTMSSLWPVRWRRIWRVSCGARSKFSSINFNRIYDVHRQRFFVSCIGHSSLVQHHG